MPPPSQIAQTFQRHLKNILRMSLCSKNVDRTYVLENLCYLELFPVAVVVMSNDNHVKRDLLNDDVYSMYHSSMQK